MNPLKLWETKMLAIALTLFLGSQLSAQVRTRAEYLEGIRQYRAGDLTGAAQSLESLGSRLEDYPTGYFVLGRIFRRDPNKNLPLAKTYLKKFILINRNKNEQKIALINMAYVDCEIGNSSVAKSEVDNLINEYPEDSDTRFCYAIVYNSLGYSLVKSGSLDNIKESTVYFKKSIEKWPKSFETRNNLVYALSEILDSGSGSKGDICPEMMTQLRALGGMIASLKRSGRPYKDYENKYLNTKKRVKSGACGSWR